MATEVIILLMVLGLFVLVSIGFAVQTVEKNRQAKKRIERILQNRLKNISVLLDQFPDGILSSDLKILICRSLIEVYDEFLSINPAHQGYQKKRTELIALIQELQLGKNKLTYDPFTSQAQINQVKGVVGDYKQFVAKLKSQSKITPTQAKEHLNRIEHLKVQANIDSLAIAANEAESANKTKLAEHYYQTIMEKIESEGLESIFHTHVVQCQKKITELAAIIEQEEAELERVKEEQKAKARNVDDDFWKKKQVYD